MEDLGRFLALTVAIAVAANQSREALADVEMPGGIQAAKGVEEVTEPKSVNWTQDLLGQASCLRVGDSITEAGLIETGDASQAQFAWALTSGRLAPKSTVNVSPDLDAVHLIEGEILLHRAKSLSSQELTVSTATVQVRLHEGTMLVQSDAEKVRITMLDGAGSVLNRADKSVVRIGPGVVYELVAKDANANQLDGFTEIASIGHSAIRVFETRKTQTFLRQVDAHGLLAHGLLQDVVSRLPQSVRLEELLSRLSSAGGSEPSESCQQSIHMAVLRRVEILGAPGRTKTKLVPAVARLLRLQPTAAAVG